MTDWTEGFTIALKPQDCVDGNLAFEIRTGRKFGLVTIHADLIGAVSGMDGDLREFLKLELAPTIEAMNQLRADREVTAGMTMVERVAMAIDPEAFGLPAYDLGEYGASDRDEARLKARAAIEAMREPMERMERVGYAAIEYNVTKDACVGDDAPLLACRAMIDGALLEG